MRILSQKKKTALGYPEVRAVAAMTDEELRRAFADYGTEPLTRLPDVMRTLTTDSQQTAARTISRALYRSVTGVLKQPRTIGELTGFAVLLICFGIIMSWRVPVDSIAPVALQMFGAPPPIQSSEVLFVNDSSRSRGRVAHSRRNSETENNTQALTKLTNYPIISFATHATLNTDFDNRWDSMIETPFCDMRDCDELRYKWYKDEQPRGVATIRFDDVFFDEAAYESRDYLVFAHSRPFRTAASELSMLGGLYHRYHLNRQVAHSVHIHLHLRSGIEPAVMLANWSIPAGSKNWSRAGLPGYRHGLQYEIIHVGAHSFAPMNREKLIQEDPLDEHHDLIDSNVIGRAGSPREQFLHP